MSGREGSDAFTRRIASLTDGVKQNIEYKKQFMESERQKAYEYKRGKAEGVQQGKQEKAVEDARNLLNLKLGIIEQIAQAVCLPLENVQQLAEELATTNA